MAFYTGLWDDTQPSSFGLSDYSMIQYCLNDKKTGQSNPNFAVYHWTEYTSQGSQTWGVPDSRSIFWSPNSGYNTVCWYKDSKFYVYFATSSLGSDMHNGFRLTVLKSSVVPVFITPSKWTDARISLYYYNIP